MVVDFERARRKKARLLRKGQKKNAQSRHQLKANVPEAPADGFIVRTTTLPVLASSSGGYQVVESFAHQIEPHEPNLFPANVLNSNRANDITVNDTITDNTAEAPIASDGMPTAALDPTSSP